MPILKGKQPTIPGFSSIAVPVAKLFSILHYMQAHGTHYGLGCKPVPLAASPPTFADPQGHAVNAVDCSGFHRYCLSHACGITIPDGSSNQNDWYAANGFKHHAIDEPGDYTAGLSPKVVYACFCRASHRGEAIGHVWFIVYVNGQWWTLESHGGHGPNSRPALTPILAHIVTDIYAVG